MNTEPTEPCFMDYVDAVDGELQRRFAIGVMDAGIDFDDLAAAEEDGETPAQYAERYGEKYDLQTRKEFRVF